MSGGRDSREVIVMDPFMSVVDTAAFLRTGQVSAREVVASVLARIERLEPTLRSFVTVAAEQALCEADALDAKRLRGEALGLLHGVPIGVKDTIETAGIRTTYGSTLYDRHVPGEDQLCVARLRAAGAIIIGKTNTPEFAIGPFTYNKLAGLCVNPHDVEKTPGGSSGGSAAALAAGLCTAAVGSDFGGSLRVPASFCGVVGFRTSPGRVPQYPKPAAWDTLSVNGPMTRNVRDTALVLAVMAGPDARDPISVAESGESLLLPQSPAPIPGLRVAWSSDLGSIPVQKAVRAACEGAVARFPSLGWTVEEAHPDITGITEFWNAVRAFLILPLYHRTVMEHRDVLSESLVWNVEHYAKLTALEVGLAEQARTRFYHHVRELLTRFDLLVTPAVSVEPWAAGVPFPTHVDGVPVANYYDWAKLSWVVSVTGLPALSVPCGRTASGMPVNLQIVGPYLSERRVLAAAQALESELGLDLRPPPPYGSA
jgi:amidase